MTATLNARRECPGPRRTAGTGSLLVRPDRLGRRTWYGKWNPSRGKQIKRRLGVHEDEYGRVIMDRLAAEDELARLMGRPRLRASRQSKASPMHTAYRHVRLALQELDGLGSRTAAASMSALYAAEDALVEAIGDAAE